MLENLPGRAREQHQQPCGLCLGSLFAALGASAAHKTRHAEARSDALAELAPVSTVYLGEDENDETKPSQLKVAQRLDTCGTDALQHNNFDEARAFYTDSAGLLKDVPTEQPWKTHEGVVPREWQAEAHHQLGLAEHHLAKAHLGLGDAAAFQAHEEAAIAAFEGLRDNHFNDLFPLTKTALFYNLAVSAGLIGDAADANETLRNHFTAAVENLKKAPKDEDFREDLGGSMNYSIQTATPLWMGVPGLLPGPAPDPWPQGQSAKEPKPLLGRDPHETRKDIDAVAHSRLSFCEPHRQGMFEMVYVPSG